jgi:hypothetical protein
MIIVNEQVIICGNTFNVKDRIKEIGGKFTKNGCNNMPGWILPKNKLLDAEELVKSYNAKIDEKEIEIQNKKKKEVEMRKLKEAEINMAKEVKNKEKELQNEIKKDLQIKLISLPISVVQSSPEELATNKIILSTDTGVNLSSVRTKDLIYLLDMYAYSKNLKNTRFGYDIDGNIVWYFDTKLPSFSKQEFEYFSNFMNEVNKTALYDDASWKILYNKFFPMCV